MKSSIDREDCAMDASPFVTVPLTASELRLIRSALLSFVTDFGHDEADVLHAAQHLLAKLADLSVDASGPAA
ncbi:MAG: hypothetical protein JWN47_1541 [Frankiales bacterium]|jgi:hypothetical protein|nr:hypothetical protein [Frankiales bacterium]MDQ1691963.1 hypothetical protein [Pseudonocardiales bacterium]